MERTKDDELLTLKEAAALLKISTMTLSRWLKQGRVRGYQVGPKSIRIRRRDLEDLLAPRDAETKEETPVRSPVRIKPLSSTEIARQQAALERAVALRARLLHEHGGRVLPSSADLIAHEREERSAGQ